MADEAEYQGQTADSATMAQLIQKSERRVQDLAKAGVLQRVGKNRYAVVPSIHGLIRDYEAQIAALRNDRGGQAFRDARARQIELATAREQRELIPFDEAVEYVTKAAAIIARLLDSLPARLTRDINERDRIQTIVDALRGEMDGDVARLQEAYETAFGDHEDADAVDAGPVGEGEPDLSSDDRVAGEA